MASVLLDSAVRGVNMNIVRFDPFRELEAMTNRLNRFFDPSIIRRDEPDAFSGWAPAIDVEETDKEYRIKADLPEITKSDVKVSIEDGILTIEGERKQEKEEKNKKYHRVERLYGKFVRRLNVPSDVAQDQVAAEFANGVLNVHLPKSAVSKPRNVEVRIA
jgi:HSP20 family protein